MIDVNELADMKRSGETFFLLDVREPHEADLAVIEGSTLIPLGQVPTRLDEIPKDMPVVAYCHHGGRSQRALQYLQTQGFTDLANVVGGVDQWAEQIDPDMARY